MVRLRWHVRKETKRKEWLDCVKLSSVNSFLKICTTLLKFEWKRGKDRFRSSLRPFYYIHVACDVFVEGPHFCGLRLPSTSALLSNVRTFKGLSSLAPVYSEVVCFQKNTKGRRPGEKMSPDELTSLKIKTGLTSLQWFDDMTPPDMIFLWLNTVRFVTLILHYLEVRRICYPFSFGFLLFYFKSVICLSFFLITSILNSAFWRHCCNLLSYPHLQGLSLTCFDYQYTRLVINPPPMGNHLISQNVLTETGL